MSIPILETTDSYILMGIIAQAWSWHCFSEAKAQSDPVKITFDLPVDAADRLSQLAESSDHSLLRELGIVSFQLQGDKVHI
jgi:uncharacterized protein (DUF2384 family)